ncbi:MAG: hypothetical protein ABGW69_00410 [Nanoarchaeota archaeon]
MLKKLLAGLYLLGSLVNIANSGDSTGNLISKINKYDKIEVVSENKNTKISSFEKKIEKIGPYDVSVYYKNSKDNWQEQFLDKKIKIAYDKDEVGIKLKSEDGFIKNIFKFSYYKAKGRYKGFTWALNPLERKTIKYGSKIEDKLIFKLDNNVEIYLKFGLDNYVRTTIPSIYYENWKINSQGIGFEVKNKHFKFNVDFSKLIGIVKAKGLKGLEFKGHSLLKGNEISANLEIRPKKNLSIEFYYDVRKYGDGTKTIAVFYNDNYLGQTYQPKGYEKEIGIRINYYF